MPKSISFRSLINRKKKNGLVTVITCPWSSCNSRTQIKIFKKFNVNGDRRISSSEIRSFLESLRYTVTEAELETMIKEVDADGDGSIDLGEFIEPCHQSNM